MVDFQKNILLAPYTTYQIGGPADYFFVARTTTELVQTIQIARKRNILYFVLGTGANILVGDKGFRGLVIHNATKEIFFQGDVVTADSGVTIKHLIEKTASAGLSGLEHFAGIPSSVGGAVRQNLHFLAPDRKTTLFIADTIKEATLLTGSGEIQKVDRGFFQFDYDYSRLHIEKDLVVLTVTFQLQKGNEADIRQQVTENLAWRAAKQPPVEELPSCGSVFKQIKGVGAGRLIEQAGLKGQNIGGAQISERHANFIVNRSKASAADVLALIELAQKTVKERTGYQLEMEIEFIGE